VVWAAIIILSVSQPLGLWIFFLSATVSEIKPLLI
jgi:hypothetical protein